MSDKRKFATTKRSMKKFQGQRPGEDANSKTNVPTPPVEIELTAQEVEVRILFKNIDYYLLWKI